MLDARSGENFGMKAITAPNETWDVPLPLNVNDADINPEMTTFPPPQEGWSDVKLSLLRLKVERTFSNIYNLEKDSGGENWIQMLERKRQLLEEAKVDIAKTIYNHYDPTNDLQRLGQISSQSAIAKTEFIIQEKARRLAETVGQPQPYTPLSKLREILTLSSNLEDDPAFERFSWLIKLYKQWYATAHTYERLLKIPVDDPEARETLEVAERYYLKFGDEGTSYQGGIVWTVLQALRAKVVARFDIPVTPVHTNTSDMDTVLDHMDSIPSNTFNQLQGPYVQQQLQQQQLQQLASMQILPEFVLPGLDPFDQTEAMNIFDLDGSVPTWLRPGDFGTGEAPPDTTSDMFDRGE
jgi:hypothetical protein